MRKTDLLGKLLPARAYNKKEYKDLIFLDRFHRGVKAGDFIVYTPTNTYQINDDVSARVLMLGLVTGIEQKDMEVRTEDGGTEFRKQLHFVGFYYKPGEKAEDVQLRKLWTTSDYKICKVNIHDFRDTVLYSMALVLQQHMMMRINHSRRQVKAVDVIGEIANGREDTTGAG